MFTSSHAVFECRESIAEIAHRWQRLVATSAQERTLSGPREYRGVVSEQGFELTMTSRGRGLPVSCHGQFESTPEGTRIRVQFLPAITVGRMVFLAGMCIGIGILVLYVCMIWATKGWVPISWGVVLAMAVLTLISMLGAGLVIVGFMLIYWFVVRLVRDSFRRDLVGSENRV